MSVPLEKREPGTLDMNTKARQLCTYTLQITVNDKNFPAEQDAFTQKIRDAALEIHLLCWEAINIKVDKSINRYNRRIKLLDIASGKCVKLAAMIDIAKPLFHLSSKRVTYWSDLITDVFNAIQQQRLDDIKTLKPPQLQ